MKKILSFVAVLFAVFAVNAQNATVILTVDDPAGDGSGVWGDGSGYQVVFDANNTPVEEAMVPGCGDAYEYAFTVPANAAGDDQSVVVTGSQEISIAPGAYFYAVLNPGCTDYEVIYVANSECNDPSYGSDFVIEAGKTYTFAVTQIIDEEGYMNDCVTITVTNSTTAIVENEITNLVFPNPATTVLNVNAQGYDNVQIINLLGQVVYSANAESNMQINVQGLTNGTYFVRMNGANGSNTQKFIKK